MARTLNGGNRAGCVVNELGCDLWKHCCLWRSQRLWEIDKRDRAGGTHSVTVILFVVEVGGRICDSLDVCHFSRYGSVTVPTNESLRLLGAGDHGDLIPHRRCKLSNRNYPPVADNVLPGMTLLNLSHTLLISKQSSSPIRKFYGHLILVAIGNSADMQHLFGCNRNRVDPESLNESPVPSVFKRKIEQCSPSTP